jgi:hypothetical protein
VQLLGQVLEDVAAFVLLAPLHERTGAEDLQDRAPERLGAVDDPQARGISIQTALDEIGQQRAHHLGLLGAAFPESEDVFPPIGVQAQGDQHHARPWKWIPSIMTTGRLTSIRRESHSVSRSVLKATKRCETELLQTANCFSLAGSGSSLPQ